MAGVGQLVVAVADAQADAVRRRGPDTELGPAVAGRKRAQWALEGIRGRHSQAFIRSTPGAKPPVRATRWCPRVFNWIMRLLLALVLGLLLAPAASAQVVEPLPPAATTGAARDVDADHGDGDGHRGPQRLRDDVPLRVRHHHDLRPADGREAGGNRRRQTWPPRRTSRGSRPTRPTTTGSSPPARRGPRWARTRPCAPSARRGPRACRGRGAGRDRRAVGGPARAPSTPTTPRPAIASSTAAPRGSAPARPSARLPEADGGGGDHASRSAACGPYRRYYFRSDRHQLGGHDHEPHAHVHDRPAPDRDHPRGRPSEHAVGRADRGVRARDRDRRREHPRRPRAPGLPLRGPVLDDRHAPGA